MWTVHSRSLRLVLELRYGSRFARLYLEHECIGEQVAHAPFGEQVAHASFGDRLPKFQN